MASIFESTPLNRRLFFPRRDDTPPPPGARDDMVLVAPDVRIHCRAYPATDPRFRLIYFHGNGEVVADHDPLHPAFARLGARWLVCDYRGYGRSDGEPSLPHLLADAVAVYNHVRATPNPLPLAVMGRSLGSAPAIELGGRFPDIAALVIESGYADPLGLVRRRGLPTAGITPAEAAPYDNARNIRRVRCPLLVMHGARDHLIAADEARTNISAAGSEFKQLEILEGVGHNDILFAPGNAYFRVLDRFFQAVFPKQDSG
jgi:pimeloyl-ACP methyl ester carboxylesterase